MTSMTFYARGDSSSANNAALNAQNTSQTPTTELRFESTLGGDIILDYHSGDPDPDTVVFVDGVERSFWVEFSGTLPHTNKLSNVNGEDLRGQEIVVITTDDGQRYFFLTNGTTSYATMDAFPNGAHAIDGFTTNTNVYICFGTGTRILTPKGERPVEDLRPGDRVLTASGEASTILWASQRDVSANELAFRPESRPVRIRRDSFGPGRPYRDLTLSKQHRVLVRNWYAELMFGQNEVFVRASHLPEDMAAEESPEAGVIYHHLLLDQHQVLISNGLETESLYPGDMVLDGLDPDVRQSFEAAMLQMAGSHKDYGPTARVCLRKWEAAMLFDCMPARDDAPEPPASEPQYIVACA